MPNFIPIRLELYTHPDIVQSGPLYVQFGDDKLIAHKPLRKFWTVV